MNLASGDPILEKRTLRKSVTIDVHWQIQDVLISDTELRRFTLSIAELRYANVHL